MKNLLMLIVALFVCAASFGQKDSKENKELFTKTLREAAKDPKSAVKVANMYYEGIGTPIDMFAAFDWYKKGLKALDNESKFRLAMIYFVGEVTPSNPTKANTMIKELVAVGYEPAIKVAQKVAAADPSVNKPKSGEYISNAEFFGKGKTVKEVWPQFFGGRKAMDDYIAAETSYPEEAIKRKMKGQVIVRAMIDTLGRVTKVRVLKRLDPNLDFVAARAIRNMPRWEPGYVEKEYKGEIRRLYQPYIQVFPINFQLIETEDEK